jgi:hypothetical protein
MQQINSAIDIIYSLPEALSKLLSKVEALETRNAVLEQKLNILLASKLPIAVDQDARVNQEMRTDPQQKQNESAADDDSGQEIMEIRQLSSQPFSFDVKPEKPVEVQPLAHPVKSQDAIKIPSKEVDPMPQNAIHSEPVPEKQTSTLIRGRLKEREGSSIAAVDVKIFDDKSVMVKKTKTAATGEWIAMLPPGEYTAEFTKPGQKPLFKPISIVSGKKELEILI